MALNYYNARASLRTAPAKSWKDDYQEFVNWEFENASDYYVVQEELTFGTQVYANIETKINHAIDSSTGSKLGDDYRTIIFKDLEHPKGLGYRYRFDNNTWLTINSDLYKFVTASTVIKRCNNILKWKNKYGVVVQEPCVIDYDFGGNSILFDQTINIPNGNLIVTMQYNQNTKDLKINDRFIFSGQAWKVRAINNFFNNQTGVQDTTPLIYLYIYKDSESEGDNFVDNIPANNIDYTIDLNFDSINQSIGFSTQLLATVKLNGQIVSEPVVWASSNNSIATVSSTGILNLVSNGSCNIQATMQNNTSVFIAIPIQVQSTPVVDSEIVVLPDVGEILTNKTVTYSAFLYINGVQQANPVSVVGSGASLDKYKLTIINNNSFSVTCNKFSTTPLTLTLNSGAVTLVKNIKLKGAY